jgi:Kef-type K+ transport system membrane component KefB
MDELTSLGLILLLALAAGHLVKVLRVPEVTGYLLAGVALGPSVLGWLTQDNLIAMGVMSEVALGLILFSVGSVFEVTFFRRIGRRVVLITLVESTAAVVLVTVGTLVLGQTWPVACLLGAVAIATAPASTLMVVRECHADGPLTAHLLGIIAVNNLLCITAYSLVAAAIDLQTGMAGSASLGGMVYRSAFIVIWEIVGSVALGLLIGLLRARWAPHVVERGEMLILLAGAILVCVGVARLLELSPLIASLAVGATLVNFTDRQRHLFAAISSTDPPFYAIFFVMAGAELDVALIPEMGLLGLVYLVGRATGKFAGARIAAARLGMDPKVRQFLGFALLAQAGLAVGITLAINGRYPALAPIVSTVVLASVAVYEVIGPIGTRFALVQSGEAGRTAPPSGAALVG